MRHPAIVRSVLFPSVCLLCISLASACSIVPVRPDGSPETITVDDYLKRGARTMWIAPHPDDELFAGSLLARSSIHYGNPLYFLVLNHGDGGECGLKLGCHPSVAAVRGQEMKVAAESYKAQLQQERFFNAPLPMSSFPARHELFEIWKRQGQPIEIIAEAIRRFKPDLVLTHDPFNGFTGHPEHQLTARLAVSGIRMAADQKVELSGLAPHKVGRVYQVLNRYWLVRVLGKADPKPVTETWDATRACTEELSCLDFMLRATKAHRTQHRDMANARKFSRVFETVYLRQVDPDTQDFDPAQVD